MFQIGEILGEVLYSSLWNKRWNLVDSEVFFLKWIIVHRLRFYTTALYDTLDLYLHDTLKKVKAFLIYHFFCDMEYWEYNDGNNGLFQLHFHGFTLDILRKDCKNEFVHCQKKIFYLYFIIVWVRIPTKQNLDRIWINNQD